MTQEENKPITNSIHVRPSVDKIRLMQENAKRTYRDDMRLFTSFGGQVTVYPPFVSGIDASPKPIAYHQDISLPGRPNE